MSATIVLIDFENVQKVELELLPPDTRVLFFVGAMQTAIPFPLVEGTHSRGNKVRWIKIDDVGPEAVDSVIHYYLGRFAQSEPDTELVVLSKDKGYDPLLRHAAAQGVRCRRITSLAVGEDQNGTIDEAEDGGRSSSGMEQPPSARASQVDIKALHQRALALLKKLPARSRPKTKKKLIGTMTSYFRTESEEARMKILQQLFSRKQVAEVNRQLVYDLD